MVTDRELKLEGMNVLLERLGLVDEQETGQGVLLQGGPPQLRCRGEHPVQTGQGSWQG